MEPCTEFKPLLMGLIDNELEPQESIAVNNHLLKCEACRKEIEAMKATNATIKKYSASELHDRELDRLWKNPVNKIVHISALILLIGGWLLLTGYGLYEFFTDGSEGFIPKISIASLIIGTVFLFIYVLGERLSLLKSDPYKEVQR